MADREAILVLTTGGTIVSHYDGEGRKRYPDLSASAEPLVAMAERAGQRAEVEAIASVGSQDMGRIVWHDLVARIRRAAEEDRWRGVVVTHGTDTLEETAFLLELLVDPPIALVLTGAMLAADNPSSDGPANFAAALSVAAHVRTAAQGALVVMDDEIHAARRVFKRATHGARAFASSGEGPVGFVTAGYVEYGSAAAPFPHRFGQVEPALLPEVGLLACHADMNPHLCRATLAVMPGGVVVAGLGDGNVPAPIAHELAAFVARGGIVVRSSRVDGGRVPCGGEIDDDLMGFVAANDLSPCKARLLLQCLLADGETERERIQAAFDA
ncbi:MAG: asparaginase [Sphingopyxis sp.]|nr:asparaginase [Sphingopyxis sp.]